MPHRRRHRPRTVFPREAHLGLGLLVMALIVMPTFRWLQSLRVNTAVAFFAGIVLAVTIIAVIQRYIR